MNVAPQIICLCGCFIDWIVYFSSILLPGGRLMFLLCRANYCRVDSSYDKIFPQSSALRVTCCLANARELDYIAAVRRHLREGLNNFRSKAKLRSHETVIELTFVPVWNRAAWIFLQESVDCRLAMRFIKRSSPEMIFLAHPLLTLSLNITWDTCQWLMFESWLSSQDFLIDTLNSL